MPAPANLQPLLRQPYDRDRWHSVLEDILPSGALAIFQKAREIDASCDHVTAVVQTGRVSLGEDSIALLEVRVADQIKLARNRVALRNFVARFIDEAATSAVIAVFHQPGQPEWRLTYASRRSVIDDDSLDITTVQTAPRRFTFLLGPAEPCRTAAGRFAEMRERADRLTLADVEKAFSVERLNKDFFKRYKEHYEKFTAHLLSPTLAASTRRDFGIASLEDPADQLKADKPVRDFVKRLLGRLVFLHFLQKKRWLGCPAGTKPWTGGDPDFLRSYLTQAEAAAQAHQFHSLWLVPLFFQALNTPDRPGDLFPPTGTRLPYLNGGLFEDDSPALKALDFPADLFRELLDFFGQYHFTIDENDPEDHEVGIDPEMLGHIFENLLEDNKDKGAYYTPKAIVQYMARQSLLHYLQTHLGPHPELALLLNEKDFTRLEKNGFVHTNAKRIADLLDSVKICDPAIGSGAFPIGLLHEILWTRLALDLTLNNPADRANLKRRIIQHSIHGVDLDPGAVEIARLRFWLALVVDEDQPRPLPNLDYKIMQGDGLLESFNGIDLSRLQDQPAFGHTLTAAYGTQAELFLDDARKQLELRTAEHRDEISRLTRDYYSETQPKEKRRKHKLIDDIVLSHLEYCAEYEFEAVETQIHRLKTQFKERRKQLKDWSPPAKDQSKLDILENQRTTLLQTKFELAALHHERARPFFLWHLFFRDVFGTGGFDIIVANPPYVRADNPDALIERKKVEATGLYETLWEKWDLYVAFIERGFKMLRPGGVLCYIVSDAYCHSKYAEKSQNWFLANARILRLDFLADLKVFDAAVRNVLFFFQRAAGADWLPERHRHTGRFNEIEVLPTQPQANATHRLFFPETGPKTISFTIKTVPLEDICYITKGMVAHANEKLCQGAFKLDDLISDTKDKIHPKPFVEGKFLGRWLPEKHRWLEWGTTRSPEQLSRPTFQELYEVPEKLISVDMAAGCEQLRVAYDDAQLYHNHSAWSFVPWHLLVGVANRSLQKQARYRHEKPKPDARNRESLEKLSESYDAKYLLAVMNSSVARDWIMSRRRSNIHLYPDDWKPLPVPVVSAAAQKKIEKLVSQLLERRRKNPKADISDLDAILDNEVRQLYGLTAGPER